MSGEPILVGIGVAADGLEVDVQPSGERFRAGRTAEELERLVERIAPLRPMLVLLEARPGGTPVPFADVAALAPAFASLPVVIADPRRVRVPAVRDPARAATRG